MPIQLNEVNRNKNKTKSEVELRGIHSPIGLEKKMERFNRYMVKTMRKRFETMVIKKLNKKSTSCIVKTNSIYLLLFIGLFIFTVNSKDKQH